MQKISGLTDYQLYEIIQNIKSDKNIRKLANEEFDKRNLTIEQKQKIAYEHYRLFVAGKNTSLDIQYKILVLLFPFLFFIHSIIASRLLGFGNKRKWTAYWRCLSIGCMVWIIAIILLYRYWH